MSDNWVEQIGKPAFECIADMVAYLKADRERLQELRESDDPDDAEELAELEQAVTLDGEELSEEEAHERIQEDPLSIRIFGERTDGKWEADKAEILLSTGGPAVRIQCYLGDWGEPRRAWLDVQDWGKPWTQYFCDSEILLAYCRCFYFGE